MNFFMNFCNLVLTFSRFPEKRVDKSAKNVQDREEELSKVVTFLHQNQKTGKIPLDLQDKFENEVRKL